MYTGTIIKTLRKKHKLTQDELGEILGVKKSQIQKYESGATQNLKLDTLKTLCKHFNVPPWVFIYSEKINDIEGTLDFYIDVFHWEELLQFNDKGKEKIVGYIRDIAKIKEYTE